MNNSTVSVIVPVWGTEKYLRQALESVVNQTFQDWEIVIVDDSSPDNAIDIAMEYFDKYPDKITVIKQINRGLAGARNTAIRASKGRYIALLDSDDIFFPTKLEECVKFLDNNPDVGMTYTWSQLLDEEDNWIDSYQMSDMGSYEADYWMYRNPPGNGSSPVIRRECLEEIAFDHPTENDRVCYFDEDMRRAEDIECWIRINALTSWTLKGIPKVLTGYRVNPESLSADTDKQFKAWEQTMEKVKGHSPLLVKKYYSLSKAYMLRYLSRRSMELGKPRKALGYLIRALSTNLGIWKEWKITIYVVVVVVLSNILPHSFFKRVKRFLTEFAGNLQRKNLA
ncbi:glycosyltransferase family 2 protein [Calothrix sp. FACHB-1219]|uniref:glycosyltransferase family 2 protein n=1 Tax=unclassified Calothrix TaxID=2619626 RepID=UPI00168A272C|nr:MULTISPECIES: glycosyltransferase family 2 protein [unclassified Calothrix]MBD2201597.1 glycosyltransferase family 2 protein [Calothrix sp. FACHB-168]MBD2217283.1 glycosyltransferase family 2 protein [Calothrix sp. FACHB-1219]